MNKYKLGAIGAGHMGMAMLDAAVREKALAAGEIAVYDLSAKRTDEARERGFAVLGSEREVFENCVCLFLAVLPQNVETVLTEISKSKNENDPAIVSIVSGTGSEYIRGFLGEKARVVCVVPNLGLSVNLGASAVSRTENVPDEIFNAVVGLLETTGRVAVAEESLLKEIIPANGCAPGYAYYFIDAVATACEKNGVDYKTAAEMTAAAFAGAAKLLLESGAGPRELLSKVCSPGGLTAKGIERFDELGVFGGIAAGTEASAARGRELAK